MASSGLLLWIDEIVVIAWEESLQSPFLPFPHSYQPALASIRPFSLAGILEGIEAIELEEVGTLVIEDGRLKPLAGIGGQHHHI